MEGMGGFNSFGMNNGMNTGFNSFGMNNGMNTGFNSFNPGFNQNSFGVQGMNGFGNLLIK